MFRRRIDRFEEQMTNTLQEMMECMKTVMSQTSVKLTDQMTINSCDHFSCLSCDKTYTNIQYEKEAGNLGPPLSRSQSLQCTSFPMSTNRIPLRNTKSLLETMYEVSTPNLLVDPNVDTLDDSLCLDNTLECISSLENIIDGNRLSKQSEPVLNAMKKPILSRALSLQSCLPSIKLNESEIKEFSDPLTHNPFLESMASQQLNKSLLSINESDGQTQEIRYSSLSDDNLVSTQLLQESSSTDSQIFK